MHALKKGTLKDKARYDELRKPVENQAQELLDRLAHFWSHHASRDASRGRQPPDADRSC